MAVKTGRERQSVIFAALVCVCICLSKLCVTVWCFWFCLYGEWKLHIVNTGREIDENNIMTECDRCRTLWWSRTMLLCRSISWSRTPMRRTVLTTRLCMTSASALWSWPLPPTATWTTWFQQPCPVWPPAFDSLARYCANLYRITNC